MGPFFKKGQGINNNLFPPTCDLSLHELIPFAVLPGHPFILNSNSNIQLFHNYNHFHLPSKTWLEGSVGILNIAI